MINKSNVHSKVKGPVFSILTPFLPHNDEIDYKSLEKYIEYIFMSGGRIFYVMAYNSRYSQLTFEEIKEVNRFVVTKVKELSQNNVVIVADPPHCSTKVTLEFVKHAENIGADLISLIVRERYYSDDQIFNHFRIINENSSIGILIHEMPFLNGLGGPIVQWPITLLDRVADLSNVVAIKEDAKDDEYSGQVVALLKDRLSIIISGRGKEQWLKFADKGCHSWLNGIGVFEPKLAIRFWRAWNANDTQTQEFILNKIESPFFEHGVKRYGWHLAIKVALQLYGHMSQHDRMPLMPLPEDKSNEFIAVLEKLPVSEICS